MSLKNTSILRIAPAVLIVLLCFIGIGATISIIPFYVHSELRQGTGVVGLVVAVQYLAMLAARPAAGGTADRVGPVAALRRGTALFLVCGLAYLISAWLSLPMAKLILLWVARAVLGVAESYVITGCLAWSVEKVGPQHAGMVMAWNGNAMYGGIALGAYAVSLLPSGLDFSAVALLAVSLGVAAVLLAHGLPKVQPMPVPRTPFIQTVGLIMQPGLGLLMASVGYGMILSFVGIFFRDNGWSSSFLAITLFGSAYVAARLFFGGLPDRFGGVKVATVSLAIEFTGQLLLFLSGNELLALLGALLSGAGFSMAVPALGVIAVRRVPPHVRGSAMAAFLAFFDLAFGATIPIAGILADHLSARSTFLFGAISAVAGLFIVWRIKQYGELSAKDGVQNTAGNGELRC